MNTVCMFRQVLYVFLVDTPDPYVKVYIAVAPEARRQTKYIRNNKCPEWNETFSFLLPTYGATADVEVNFTNVLRVAFKKQSSSNDELYWLYICNIDYIDGFELP